VPSCQINVSAELTLIICLVCLATQLIAWCARPSSSPSVRVAAAALISLLRPAPLPPKLDPDSPPRAPYVAPSVRRVRQQSRGCRAASPRPARPQVRAVSAGVTTVEVLPAEFHSTTSSMCLCRDLCAAYTRSRMG
jgi:hypothetical protein